MVNEEALRTKYLSQTPVSLELFQDYRYQLYEDFESQTADTFFRILSSERASLIRFTEAKKSEIPSFADKEAREKAQEKMNRMDALAKEIRNRAAEESFNAGIKKRYDSMSDKYLKMKDLTRHDNPGFSINKGIVTSFDVDRARICQKYAEQIEETIRSYDRGEDSDLNELAAHSVYVFFPETCYGSNAKNKKAYQDIQGWFGDKRSRYYSLRKLVQDRYYRNYKQEGERQRSAQLAEEKNERQTQLRDKEENFTKEYQEKLEKQWQETLPLIQKLCENHRAIDPIVEFSYRELIKRDDSMPKGREIALVRYPFYLVLDTKCINFFYESGYSNPLSSFEFEKNNFRPLSGHIQVGAMTIVLLDLLYQKMMEDPRYELATISMTGTFNKICFEISYPNPYHEEIVSIF